MLSFWTATALSLGPGSLPLALMWRPPCLLQHEEEEQPVEFLPQSYKGCRLFENFNLERFSCCHSSSVWIFYTFFVTLFYDIILTWIQEFSLVKAIYIHIVGPLPQCPQHYTSMFLQQPKTSKPNIGLWREAFAIPTLPKGRGRNLKHHHHENGLYGAKLLNTGFEVTDALSQCHSLSRCNMHPLCSVCPCWASPNTHKHTHTNTHRQRFTSKDKRNKCYWCYVFLMNFTEEF